MAEENDQEKTEQATPRRLDKAREDGQIARSRELSTFTVLVTGVASMWFLAPWMFDRMGMAVTEGLRFDHALVFDPSLAMRHVGGLLIQVGLALAPVLGALAIAAFIAPLALGGWLMSAKSLSPDPKRLNPLKGFKRIFSHQALAELAKAVAKTVLIACVAWLFIGYQRQALLGLAQQSIGSAIADALGLVAMCSVLILLAFIIVVLIDVPYQLFSHHRKLRMSRDEIRREHKENEGDPHLKARIRQQQQAVARRRMMSEVPKASVVITNPSHYAVALRYEAGMAVPRLVAKGADEIAARIRAVAGEHRVPLLEAPPLARALYRHCDLEREIPAGLYAAVAEVLAWVHRLALAAREGEAPPMAPVDLPIPSALSVDPDPPMPGSADR
ncbi:flagellar biosynthesis protein FlhB [Halotalea alkalilenta]|uniref:flagellar biosynthesis protein FlhB n=1 Tax=Halotalea alkalilenta TaxID=376489 RepID=UPI00048054E5|nr:flagellar biosynthesis protein FlhB [Halotalea alkalilenta]